MGGGSDVGGLYGPEDYGMNPRRTNGKRQSSRFLPSAMKGISRIEMRGINALNLQPAVPSSSFQPQRCQPKRQPLARVDEHKAENRDRRSRDSEVKSQELKVWVKRCQTMGSQTSVIQPRPRVLLLPWFFCSVRFSVGRMTAQKTSPQKARHQRARRSHQEVTLRMNLSVPALRIPPSPGCGSERRGHSQRAAEPGSGHRP